MMRELRTRQTNMARTYATLLIRSGYTVQINPVDNRVYVDFKTSGQVLLLPKILGYEIAINEKEVIVQDL